MSVNDNAYNSKSNNSKMKSPSPIYFSPYAHKKKSVENLYTEPRKIPIQTDSYSKNKTKNKISNPILTKNIINIEPQECYRKNSKYLSQTNDKIFQNNNNINNPQSYKKINSKLYLKKNVILNLSSFKEINSNIVLNQLLSNSNINTEENTSKNSKFYKNNKPGNMKFSLGTNTNTSSNYTSMKDSSSHFMKKSAGSATDLFGNTMIKNTKTKLKNSNNNDLKNINFNQINSLGHVLTTTGGNNNKTFLSPQNNPVIGQKIIFSKNEKNKTKEKYVSNMCNINKESMKVIHTQGNEPINNNNLDDKKNEIQYLLRNTYNNVKIYPTTFLNNKIIYQTENNNNMDNNSMRFVKNKSEKILIKKDDNKKNYKNNTNLQNIKSVEEVHFLCVNTIQNGKNLILKWDKYNC